MVSAAGVATAQPLFTFGLISDVQYADIPDGRSFLGVPRYYRHSILILQRAVKEWNTHQKHKFAINFGDIVDGFCPKDQSLNAVKKVVDEFEMFRGPVYHMIGNHCLYNLPRSELLPLLKIQTLDGRAYYDFSPVLEYRFVVLDSYDISAIGWPQDHPKTLEALKLLSEKNPNEDKNSPTNLEGVERRFLMFNGGVGKKQMEWLDGVLQEATTLKQKVVVCCHLPLDPGAASSAALTWNYDEVMSLIHRYNCVKVCFAGHNHKGGYCIDSHGVHHRVLEAALECPPGTDAFGSVNVYDDKISLVGTDRMGHHREHTEANGADIQGRMATTDCLNLKQVAGLLVICGLTVTHFHVVGIMRIGTYKVSGFRSCPWRGFPPSSSTPGLVDLWGHSIASPLWSCKLHPSPLLQFCLEPMSQ